MFWNIQCSFNLTSGIERSSQIMQEKKFMVMIDDVTGKPRNRSSIFPYKGKWPFFRNNRDIFIIPSVCMYHWILNMRIWLVMDYITDNVIRATNKSKLWTAIVLSIFELEKRLKAQNVWNWTGYQKFVSVVHTDQQILASTQSPIALSSVCHFLTYITGYMEPSHSTYFGTRPIVPLAIGCWRRHTLTSKSLWRHWFNIIVNHRQRCYWSGTHLTQ